MAVLFPPLFPYPATAAVLIASASAASTARGAEAVSADEDGEEADNNSLKNQGTYK